jgi:hypothetical protein
LAARVSRIWNPILCTGSRFDIGSCGTKPILVPRSSTRRDSAAPVSSVPSNSILPPRIRPARGSRPMIACAVVDFPEPLSPTMATVSPGYTVRSTPRTASTRLSPAPNVIRRSRIRSSGRSARASSVISAPRLESARPQ